MNKTLLSTSIAALLLAASQAQAGGLWLNEFGDFSGGRSSAGAAAGLTDAASIIHNPAGGSLVEGSQLFVSAGAFIPDVEFDVDYSNPISGKEDGGSAGLNAPAGGGSYVFDSGSSRWTFGTYLAGLAGAGLDYDKDWVGRFQATKSELLLIALGGTASYRVNDQLSIGAGAQYWYATLDMELGLPSLPGRDEGRASLDGTDSSYGFTLGAIYEFSDATRIGINYQSELEADFDGKLKASVADVRVDSNTELNMAQTIRIGLHHDLNDTIGLDFTWGWDDWSTLDSVFVSVPDREGALDKNWDDTYHYAIGMQYKLNSDWDLTTGVAYDTNPVDAYERTADLPVDRQIRLSGGARYQFSDTMNLGGYITYMDLGSAKIRGRNWGGEFGDNSIIAFAFNLNWVL